MWRCGCVVQKSKVDQDGSCTTATSAERPRENQPTADHAVSLTRRPVNPVDGHVNVSLSQDPDTNVSWNPSPTPQALVPDPVPESRRHGAAPQNTTGNKHTGLMFLDMATTRPHFWMFKQKSQSPHPYHGARWITTKTHLEPVTSNTIQKKLPDEKPRQTRHQGHATAIQMAQAYEGIPQALLMDDENTPQNK